MELEGFLEVLFGELEAGGCVEVAKGPEEGREREGVELGLKSEEGFGGVQEGVQKAQGRGGDRGEGVEEEQRGD